MVAFNWNTNNAGVKVDGGVSHFKPTTDGRGLLVTVIGNRIEPIAGNKGNQLVFTLRGEEGEDMGKMVDLRFGVGNTDVESAAKAADYFNGFLICQGISGSLNNLDITNGRKLRVMVQSQNDPKYPDSTNINGYRLQDGSKPGQQPMNNGGNNQGQQTQQQNNGGGNSGWGNNGGQGQQQDPNQGQNNGQNNQGQQQQNFQQDQGQQNNSGGNFQQGNFNNPNNGNNGEQKPGWA